MHLIHQLIKIYVLCAIKFPVLIKKLLCIAACVICGLCGKYWKDINIDAVEQNVKINYYYPACIDMLMSYHKGTRKDCNVDSLLNRLRSNLEDIGNKYEEEIEMLNVILSEALGN